MARKDGAARKGSVGGTHGIGNLGENIQIDVANARDVAFWARRLSYTEAEVRVCVKAVGGRVRDVRRCLAAKRAPALAMLFAWLSGVDASVTVVPSTRVEW